MAISRERLEELIEKEATIYSARIKVREISLNDLVQIYTEHGEDVIVFGYEPNDWEELKDLYETRKEAEWHLKYHATRTEELNLPMWEEIEKIKEKDVYIIAKPKEMRFYIDYKFLIPQIKLCTLEDVFNWNLDEEGYLSACDLCVKLFKREEE
jgi:hypothetical protein